MVDELRRKQFEEELKNKPFNKLTMYQRAERIFHENLEKKNKR